MNSQCALEPHWALLFSGIEQEPETHLSPAAQGWRWFISDTLTGRAFSLHSSDLPPSSPGNSTAAWLLVPGPACCEQKEGGKGAPRGGQLGKSAVNSWEAGVPSLGTFPVCCLVLWGGNVCSGVSISQAPGQSVPQHIRPRTGLKGVEQRRQERRRPAGQGQRPSSRVVEQSAGPLPNSRWQDCFLYCSLRMVVTAFSFPAPLFWFWFLALCSSCDLGRSYHSSVCFHKSRTQPVPSLPFTDNLAKT